MTKTNFKLNTELGGLPTQFKCNNEMYSLTKLFESANKSGIKKRIENYKRSPYYKEGLQAAKEIMEDEYLLKFSDRSVKFTDRPKQICSVKSTDQNLLPQIVGTNEEEAVTEIKGAVIPQVKDKDLVQVIHTKECPQGETYACDLMVYNALNYISPKLGMLAMRDFITTKNRKDERIKASEKIKEINSKIAKLKRDEFSPSVETLIKATNRLINKLAFGEHYDGIRSVKTSLKEQEALNQAMLKIDVILSVVNNVDEYVQKCKNIKMEDTN